MAGISQECPEDNYKLILVVPGTDYKSEKTTKANGKVYFIDDKAILAISPEAVSKAYIAGEDGERLAVDVSRFIAYSSRRSKVVRRKQAEASGYPACSRHPANMCPAWYAVGKCHDGRQVVLGCFEKGQRAAVNESTKKVSSHSVTVVSRTICANSSKRRESTESDTLDWMYYPSQDKFVARLESWRRIPAKRNLVLVGYKLPSGKAGLMAKLPFTAAGRTIVTVYKMLAEVSNGAFVSGTLVTNVGGQSSCRIVQTIKQ